MERRGGVGLHHENSNFQVENETFNFCSRIDGLIERAGDDWQERSCAVANSGDVVCGRTVQDPLQDVIYAVKRVDNGSSIHTTRSVSIFFKEDNCNHMVAEVTALGEKSDPRFEIHDYGRFLACDFDFFEQGDTGIFFKKGIALPEKNIQNLFSHIESISAMGEQHPTDATDTPPLAAD